MQKKEACRGEHVLCNGRKQRDGAKKIVARDIVKFAMAVIQ